MGESEKINCLWLSLAFALAVLDSKTAKLIQACFALMQLQVEHVKSLFECLQKIFTIQLMLKTHDEISAKTHHDNVPSSLLAPPPFDPAVEYVMQVHIGKHRADTATLGSALFIVHPVSVLQHSGVKPFLYMPEDAPVRNAVLDELFQPFMGDGVNPHAYTFSASRSATRSCAHASTSDSTHAAGGGPSLTGRGKRPSLMSL
jgi:hypothetical protein